MLTVLPAMLIHTWILCMILLFLLPVKFVLRPTNVVMSQRDRYEDYHETRMPNNSDNEEEDEDKDVLRMKMMM